MGTLVNSLSYTFVKDQIITYVHHSNLDYYYNCNL